MRAMTPKSIITNVFITSTFAIPVFFLLFFSFNYVPSMLFYRFFQRNCTEMTIRAVIVTRLVVALLQIFVCCGSCLCSKTKMIISPNMNIIFF